MTLIDNTEGHLEQVRAYAETVQLREQLEEKLAYLRDYRDDTVRCQLFKDFAPQSFYFVMEIKKDGKWEQFFNGGLIFHGVHDRGGDGGAPTFSVNMSPTTAWSIHT